MKNSWAQPSLPRDLALLTAATVFLVLVISGWVGYGQWWVRLLQISGVAALFLFFFWIAHARMVRRVQELTDAAAAVARGEPSSLPEGGPAGLAGLALQLRRIGEYIAETKRIEDELRNKMFTLKHGKEKADMHRRSASEFLAYACQEIRTPLTTVVGFAQVMKDQLYGPIENRKYHQYVSNIYHTAGALLDTLQNLQTLGKAETDYVELVERPVDVLEVINKSLNVVADKMQVEKLNSQLKLSDPLPRLIADDFRLQQILTNLLAHACRHTLPGDTLLIETRMVKEQKDRLFLALIISTRAKHTHTPEALAALAGRLANTSDMPVYEPPADPLKENPDLSLELAKCLIAMHRGFLDLTRTDDGALIITVLFGAGRIRFVEG